jgi:hypothetical protein
MHRVGLGDDCASVGVCARSDVTNRVWKRFEEVNVGLRPAVTPESRKVWCGLFRCDGRQRGTRCNSLTCPSHLFSSFEWWGSRTGPVSLHRFRVRVWSAPGKLSREERTVAHRPRGAKPFETDLEKRLAGTEETRERSMRDVPGETSTENVWQRARLRALPSKGERRRRSCRLLAR